MKKQQIAKLGVTLGLVAAVGVGGTLAILSQTAGPVTNTFAVGENIESGDFSLKETPVKYENGNYVKDGNKLTSTGNTYNNVLPKAILSKDPTVFFDAEKVSDMANVYMFVEVDGLDEMASMGITVSEEDWGTNWKKMNADGTVSTDAFNSATLDGIYVYDAGSSNYKIDPSELNATEYKLPAVFTELNVSSTFDTSSGLNNVVINACAVQYDNVGLAEAYREATAKF